ncbi:hypothetical protein [Methylovulum miyakonense]|uniref:hypothetical protein n=1 Tax=Methylovulum miyakonense TaxID=645578 RepID=UPI00039EF65D|nr:hypothetical protein [Methylovulum miyakonense]
MMVYQGENSKHCVAACIATILCCTLEEILSTAAGLGINPDIGMSGVDELRVLAQLGWENNIVQVSSLTNQLILGRTYLLTVPSLNTRGGIHRIVAKAKADQTFEIHDPCPSGLRYGIDHPLTGWTEVTEFVGANVWPDEATDHKMGDGNL